MRGAVLVAAMVIVAGCAETTVDTEPTEPDGATATVAPVTTPTGTPTELGAALVTEARELSDTIVEGEGDDEALARVQAIWNQLRPEVEATDPDLLEGFDAAIALAENGVRRRRPADADKAANNLAALVRAL